MNRQAALFTFSYIVDVNQTVTKQAAVTATTDLNQTAAPPLTLMPQILM